MKIEYTPYTVLVTSNYQVHLPLTDIRLVRATIANEFSLVLTSDFIFVRLAEKKADVDADAEKKHYYFT